MTVPDVLQPSSPEEAVALFEAGVTVIGGGTIVVPELTNGRLRPERALLLTRAGLAGITRDGSRVTIGATTPVSELESLAAPIGPCAANVADGEIRAQGTVGGNLCAGAGPEAPRGDLQGAFLALGATVRSAGAGGETTEPLEDFLAASPGPAAARRLASRSPRPAPSPRSTARTRTTTPRSPSRRRAAQTARSGSPPPASPGHAVRLPSAEANAERPGRGRRRRGRGRDVRRRRARVGLVPRARRCPCSSAGSSPSSRRPA